MKKLIMFSMLLLLVNTTIIAQEAENEKEQIKKVIQTAYIDGLHNKGNVDDIENGFHPGFNLLGVNDNMLTKYPIYSWVESFNKRKAADPAPLTEEQKMTCEYLLIDITGNTAMAKIQLYKNKVLIFTDYLQLYKFNEGWRIVSKTYYRH